MMLSLIFARSENRCIGREGRIPWRLPDEFAHFRRTTMGKPVLMGRRTYEDHASALPGRLNIVITRQSDYQVADGVLVAASLEDAMARARQDHDEIFVIGGVRFFAEALPQADHVYETIVHATVDGDAFLPEFDFSAWQTTVLEEHPSDERHAFAFTILRHDRVGAARGTRSDERGPPEP